MNCLNSIKTKKSFEIIFILAIGLSFVLWLLFLFIGGPESRQFTVFFGNCSNFIADSSSVAGYSSGLDPYHNMIYGLAEKAYPPLTYVIMYGISRIVDADFFGARDDNYFYIGTDFKYLAVFFICTMITVILMYTLIQVTKKGSMGMKSMTALVLCVSYPMLFSIERGNTIIITVMLSMFYLFYYNSENKILRELALIALAAAVAFKITPALLGIMLLYNKKCKEAVRAVIYGIIVVFGPFVFLRGGFSNIPVMFQNMQLNLKAYSSLDGCTLTAGLNRFGKLFSSDYVVSEQMIGTMRLITVVVCALLLLVVPFLKTNWEKTAAVVVVLIILPSHSGTYCVLYMLPVIVMFLNEEKHRTVDFLHLLCMIMICWDFMCRATDLFNYNLALPVMAGTLIITGLINVKNHIYSKKYSIKEVEGNE